MKIERTNLTGKSNKGVAWIAFVAILLVVILLFALLYFVVVKKWNPFKPSDVNNAPKENTAQQNTPSQVESDPTVNPLTPEERAEKEEEVEKFNENLAEKELELNEIKVSKFNAVLDKGFVFIKGTVENTTDQVLTNIELNIELENASGEKILDYSIVIPQIEAKSSQETISNVDIDLKQIANIKAEVTNYVPESGEN